MSMTTRISGPKLLICDDDSLFHMAVKHSLKGKYECRSAYNSDEAIAILRQNQIDVILLDVQMRTPDEGLRAIPKILDLDPELTIIMSSGLTDYKTVREAMKLGASDYMAKDFDPDELEIALDGATERKRLVRRSDMAEFEARSAQSQHVMIGRSQKIEALRKSIERIRRSAANVVIFGETGTGKEVVARQLRGTLPDGALAPFVAIDSSTIQSSTAESVLFGHEKGAFTGADRSTRGIFEEAAGGIVYFDEIANMPLEIQAKLLRVIQEHEVMRLGSSKPIQVEFRVVCATNRDLSEMAAKGQFKDDLFQRLNVLPLELPPLRERIEDIPLLIEHFVRKIDRRGANLCFTEEAVALLQRYPWPGNVRELGNLISYVVAMTDGDEVDVADLPPRLRESRHALNQGTTPNAIQSVDGSADGGSFYERVSSFERSILSDAYRATSGNVSKLALKLGMDRSHLHSKLKEYGIHIPRK